MKFTWNTPEVPRRTATYRWTAPYAANVHEGGTERSDGSVMPARPWTQAAIEETDLEEAFAENYERSGDIVEAFDDTAYYLAGRFEAMIRDERWEWDRVTKRSDGSVAGSPRTIVDTETLVNSQQEPEFSDE